MTTSASTLGNEALIVAQKDIFENDEINNQASIAVCGDRFLNDTDLDATTNLTGFNKVWVQDINYFFNSSKLCQSAFTFIRISRL
jgi:hypothetical protein